MRTDRIDASVSGRGEGVCWPSCFAPLDSNAAVQEHQQYNESDPSSTNHSIQPHVVNCKTKQCVRKNIENT